MLYDISVTIEPDMPTWPTGPAVEVIARKRIKRGDPSNASSLHISAHTGTHMDAPFHYWDEGYGIDKIPLDVFVGRARVYELPEADSIGEKDLQGLDFRGVLRALFNTKNSAYWADKRFREDFVSFTPEGAAYIAAQGVKLVGIDYFSIAALGAENQTATHNALAKKGVIILEGVNLSGIKPGDYELLCLPLKVKGCDGAPARALLRTL